MSHVSADKEEYVRPFARALEARGITYWLDEAEIAWGDGIVSSINKGLAISDFVICFMSDSFVERGWPEAELGAAIATQNSGGSTKVLPLMIAEPQRIHAEYPLLRDRAYRKWSDGIDALVRELEITMSRTQ